MENLQVDTARHEAAGGRSDEMRVISGEKRGGGRETIGVHPTGPIDGAARRARLQGVRTANILDRALPLFLENGYERVSMSMIAAAAGGSKATLYSYFPTKADLFLALMERTWDQDAQEPTASASAARDAHRWLSAWVANFLAHLHASQVVALHRLIIAEAARFPALGARLFDAGPQRTSDDLAANLSVLHDKGLVACPDAAAGGRLLRAIAKAGRYERRLWGAAEPPSARQIRAEADEAASIFLAAFGRRAVTASPSLTEE